MKIEKDKDGNITNIQLDNSPWLFKCNNLDDVEGFTGKRYYFSDELQFPCWGFEIEYRCNSSYYFFSKEDLLKLIELL